MCACLSTEPSCQENSTVLIIDYLLDILLDENKYLAIFCVGVAALPRCTLCILKPRTENQYDISFLCRGLNYLGTWVHLRESQDCTKYLYKVDLVCVYR